MAKTKVFEKTSDPAGAISQARAMIGQLQEQAKDGQIDGAMLDQLEAVLNVSADSAEDKTSEMESDANSMGTTVESAPGSPDASTTVSSVESESTPSESMPTGVESMPTTVPTSVNKVDEPFSARPPVPNLIFDNVEDMNRVLPDFIKALEGGQMKKAQKVAGDNGRNFDTLFNMAQHAILNEGGWTSDNLSKLSGGAQNDPSTLAKGVTSSSVPGYYLIRLAKLMLPVYAGLVARLPVDAPKMGSIQATWRAQLGFNTLAESSFFRVAEGSIGVNPPTNFLTFSAAYNDISVNDNVTLKALRTSAGYADPLQISVIKAMAALLRGEERVILGGNAAAISAPSTIAASGSAAGGTIAAGSFIAAVTALTYEGWTAGAKGGSAVYGESAASAASSVVTTGSTSSLALTWAAVPGAVAYNIYLAASGSSAGSATWNKTVTINKALVIAASGSAALTPPASDTTVNAVGVEGLIQWCEQSTILSNAIPDKITPYDNAGAGLTAGNGGITQFDTLLAQAWTTWHTAPSVMVMSPLMNATLVGKLQGLGSGNFYRVDITQERNTVNGGMMVTGYVNKFAPYADGTPRMIDVIPHPYMPDGTVLFLSETIPYPMGNESRGFVRDVLLPYTYFPLPAQVAGVNKTLYNFAITTSETVECFNPGPQMALVGVDKSL